MNVGRKRVQAVFYRSVNGKEPVREWLLNLSKQDRQAIGADIQTVEFGWPVGMPVCRAMTGGLYEVRTNLSGLRIARVLFCFNERYLVLLHAFVKKSQKTPQTDLKLARLRRKEVESGSNE